MKKFFMYLSFALVLIMLTACTPSNASNKDEITMVWYPNESGNDLKAARDEIGQVIEEVTGKKVEHKLTTDYAIAIETIANGNAALAFMGAQGYIEAKNKNEKIEPVVVPSGESGTIDDAVYYSWLAAREADADQYKVQDEFSLDTIESTKFSFVSNSSTSGFKVPSSDIVAHFSQKDEWKDLEAEDLMESGIFFKEVLYGDSHQGSAVNLLSERADVAAFCDTCVANYIEVAEGEASTVGAVYKVKEGAEEPFNNLDGARFKLIHVTPVLNAPFVVNTDAMDPEDLKKIQDILTSDAIASNEKIFVPEGSDMSGLFTKTAEERFLIVEDAWFDPIRNLAK